MEKMLVTQCVALSWFRCLMEEGVDFINKNTGEIERSEIIIFRNFQENTGAFDLPSANCSPKGLEKNLLEVVGNLLVYNTNPVVKEVLNSSGFTDAIKAHIEKIRIKSETGKMPT